MLESFETLLTCRNMFIKADWFVWAYLRVFGGRGGKKKPSLK